MSATRRGTHPASRTIGGQPFSSEDPGDIVFLGFDFAARASAIAAPVVTAVHRDATADAAPCAILSGAPTIPGATIVQRVAGGVAGANDLLRCQVDTAAGERFALAGVLPVRAP